MSEQNLEINQESQVPDQVVEATPQIDPIEERARELGWRPKEEFSGDDREFIDAAEFVRRQPLFEKIDHMGKELKETKKVLQMLQEHHKKVKESEYKRALDELKAEKKRALEEGDADRLLAVDDALAEVRTAQLQSQQAEQQPQVDPRFVSWVSQNRWYESDSELREFADATGLVHAKNNPHKSPEEVLDFVVKQVKRTYPDKFQNPNRAKPSAVDGSTSTPASKKKEDSFVLTEDERKVMNTFIREGVMTKDEYIAELKKVRG